MREWVNSILGQDGGRVAQFALALVAVVLLILLLGWIVRRYQPGTRLVAATGSRVKKRLGVIEAASIDNRRRLVLVRRDDIEHLVMIGGPNDVLIESRIVRGAAAGGRPGSHQAVRQAQAVEPERVAPAASGAATLSPSTAASAQLSVAQPVASPLRAARSVDNEVPAPTSAQVQTPPGPPAFSVQSQTPPPGRAESVSIDPMPAAPAHAAETRRPSLGDLLSAATSTKASDPRALPQPIVAPPPLPRVGTYQDLEEDDRDQPTQVVSYRPPRLADSAATGPAQPPAAQQIASQTPSHPPHQRPVDRETAVATQIEKALWDLGQKPVRAEPVDQVAARSAPLSQPQALPQRSEVPPKSVADSPALPAVPARLTPPIRPAPVEQPAPAARQAAPDYPPKPRLPVDPTQSIETRVITRPASYRTTEPATGSEGVKPYPPEPVTAPRPVQPQWPSVDPRLPVPPAPSTAVQAPVSAPAIIAEPPPAANTPAKQSGDELEAEMAKLLSELGGPSP